MTIISRWNFIAVLTLTACMAFGADTTPSPNPSSVDIPALVKKAESGDAKAQDTLALLYAKGEGVPKDEALAASWHRKAAEQGLARAQRSLGNCYQTGQGVPRSNALGVSWYRKAAEQGLADAQWNLGLCYAFGGGLPRDDVLAVSWFRKAAEQGLAIAQWNLGICYFDGKGVPKDDVAALMWYDLSAAQSFNTAVKDRDELSAKMTPEQIAEAQRMSREWKPTKASAMNDTSRAPDSFKEDDKSSKDSDLNNNSVSGCFGCLLIIGTLGTISACAFNVLL
jgi:TPR repeat protein